MLVGHIKLPPAHLHKLRVRIFEVGFGGGVLIAAVPLVSTLRDGDRMILETMSHQRWFKAVAFKHFS